LNDKGVSLPNLFGEHLLHGTNRVESPTITLSHGTSTSISFWSRCQRILCGVERARENCWTNIRFWFRPSVAPPSNCTRQCLKPLASSTPPWTKDRIDGGHQNKEQPTRWN
jgi:hypothetical protein